MKFLLIFLMLTGQAFSQEIAEEQGLLAKLRDLRPVIMANLLGYFDNLGLSFRSQGKANLPSWKEIGINIEEDLAFGSCRETDCDGTYYRDLALVSGARIGHASKTQLLANLDSFELRKKLIEQAKKTIYISTWSIYSDETGELFLSWLEEALKRKPKLDVRIIVDGNQSLLELGGKTLLAFKERMKNKVKVVQWHHSRYRAHVNHRKFMVVDNKDVIMGGLNIGNPYSHLFPGHSQTHSGWRDYDIHIQSLSTAINYHNLFAEMWDEQIGEGKIPSSYGRIETVDLIEQEEGIPVLLIDQTPGKSQENARHHIHTAIVKLLRNAKESIDIENAYWVLDPVLARELENVIKKNKIKVRLFTNSKESVDEPIIGMSILKSARDAARAGAEVYLKTGPTLHSKFMVVDKKITMIGSFNFSPRSLKFDAESVAVVFDAQLAEDYTKTFESGISQESRPMDINERIKCDFGGMMLELLCFNCI